MKNIVNDALVVFNANYHTRAIASLNLPIKKEG
jgi:hypothetical protein